MEEGVVSRQLIGYNGHHRLEKFYNILSRPTTNFALTSQHDVTPSLTSIKATKENVLLGQTTQENEMGHKIYGEQKGKGTDYDRYGANFSARPYSRLIPPAER